MLKILRKKQKGFTLIELIISMVIAAIIIPGIVYLVSTILTANNETANRNIAVNQLKQAVNYITNDTLTSGSVAVTNNPNFTITETWITYPAERTTFTYNIVHVVNGTGMLQRTEYQNGVLINTTDIANNVNVGLTNCVWVQPAYNTSGSLLNNGSLTVNITISIGTVNESRSLTVSPRSLQSNFNIASTITSLTSSATNNTSQYGVAVTFTATVSPSAATGTVTFEDGGVALGTESLNSSVATYTSPAFYLAPGIHDITAVYSGDSTYSPSTSATLIQQVAGTNNPVVTIVSPISGPLGGNTQVMIIGSGFFGGGSASAVTGVSFGGIPCPNYNVYSDGSISAISPLSSTAGTVDVTVTTNVATSATTPADNFTYQAAPSISSVAPNSGPTNGGTNVTITGSNFTGATAVMFGNNKGLILSSSSTQIIATSAAGTIGTVDITVTTTSGTSQTGTADQFTYVPAPIVSSISPTSGPAAGGTNVTITGQYFTGVTSVLFGPNMATTFTVNSNTSITVTSPMGAIGTVDVTVATPSGSSPTTAADKFTYSAASAAFNPTSGAVGTNVIVTGSGWAASDTITSVTVGTITATNTLQVSSSGQLTGNITVPSTLAVGGPYTIVITGSQSGAQTYTNVFTVTVITNPATFNPTSGPTGTSISVTGSGWSSHENITSVTIGGVSTSSSHLSVSSSGQLTGTITVPSSLAAGPQTIVITGANSGAQTYANAFTVTAAANFSPTSGSVGTAITVNGSGWAASDTITSVTVGGTTATYSLSVNNGILSGTITVPSSLAAGAQTIVITGAASGTQTYSKAFTVINATATFNPTSGPAGTTINVTGSGWSRYENITSVTINGTPATYSLSVTYSGLSGTITVPSTLAPGGPYTIVITGSQSGVQTYVNAFTVTSPITAIGGITGTVQVGSTLTAGAVTPSGATVSYQWLYATTSSGSYSNISGATSSTYTVVTSYNGDYIEVQATGTGSYSGTVTSADVGPVTASITAIGAISGTAQVGSTLTAGTMTPSGATASYQWYESTAMGGPYTSISGATSSTYTITASYVNNYIEVQATGTGGYSGTVTSAYVGPVTAELLTSIGAITGTVQVGSTLTAGTLTPSGATASYQWLYATTPSGTYNSISGATLSSYNVASTYSGDYIKVQATGTSGYSGIVTSTYVGPVTTPITAIGAISGTTQVGSTLSAGVITPSGATVSYQWLHATAAGGPYSNITNATSNTYTVATTYGGDYIEVQATGTGSYSGTVTSVNVGPVTTPITGVSVTGLIQVNSTLTANLTPSTATASYQWLYATTSTGSYSNIGGATSSTYTLATTYVNDYIEVQVIGTGLYTGTVTSVDVGAVTAEPITAIGAITGTVQVGSTLTAGTLTPSGATASYQWYESNTAGGTYIAISGATSSTYTIAAAYNGYYIEVKATGTSGYSGTATSAYVGPVTTQITAIGVITGTVRVGNTLTAGAVTPSGATVTYQWYESTTAGGTYNAISGATSSTYTIAAAYYNDYIEVYATGTGSYTGTVTSAHVGAVTAEPLSSIAAITGTVQVGSTLTAGTLTPSGATASYQWYESTTAGGTYTAISGATSNTYAIAAAYYNDYIEVYATGTGSYTGTVTSAHVGAVTAEPLASIAAITGSVVVGQTLTAGAVTPTGATVTYQWYESPTVGGTYIAISGATSSTYTIAAAYNGYYIEVKATGTGSYIGTVTSAHVGPVT